MEQVSYCEPADIALRCTDFSSHGAVALGICARRRVCVDDQGCIEACSMWHINPLAPEFSFKF